MSALATASAVAAVVATAVGTIHLAAAAPAASCSATLMTQLSTQACVLDTNYGCGADGASMWAAGGCRGVFACGGVANVVCSSESEANTTCACVEAANGPRVYLTLDSRNIIETSPGLQLVLGPVKKDAANPVMEETMPWESELCRELAACI